jgi:hypothetical protein
MAEKRGQTETLKYDFNTAKELQVKLNEKWYRVTPREFRSYNGERRLVYTREYKVIHEEYNGPIYYWGTNKLCKTPISLGTQYIFDVSRETQVRQGEKHLL